MFQEDYYWWTQATEFYLEETAGRQDADATLKSMLAAMKKIINDYAT